MTNEILAVQTTTRDGFEVVAARGEVDVSSADTLWSEIESAYERSDSVIVDLSGVSFLDSTGLGVLVAARNTVENADGPTSLDLVVSDAHLLKILDITGLTSLFRIHPTLEAACNR